MSAVGSCQLTFPSILLVKLVTTDATKAARMWLKAQVATTST